MNEAKGRDCAVGFLLNLHKDETMVQNSFACDSLHHSFAQLVSTTTNRCYILQQRCNVLHNSFGLRNNTDTKSDTHLDT